MGDRSKSGHRERLRERFIAGEEIAHTDEALLELVLSYSIPQKDVQPLAKKLLTEFGSLSEVLAANFEALCKLDGIKSYTAVLLKLADWIRSQHPTMRAQPPPPCQPQAQQITLLDLPSAEPKPTTTVKSRKTVCREAVIPRRGSEMFGKAVLKEAISLLPGLPDTESLGEIREFLRSHLHFSAEQTRQRYASYITRRMFPNGYADKALRAFSQKYPGAQELRDVCFYRFCKAEPLMIDIAIDLLIPSMGNGKIHRGRLREYLSERFTSSKAIVDCGKAILDALKAGGIVKADRMAISFSYREVRMPSFAFVLHSEFSEPGMYDIAKVETNRSIRAMLWNPDQILPALYELRNQGLISKVSEIDNVRQFTTRGSLDKIVEYLGTG